MSYRRNLDTFYWFQMCLKSYWDALQTVSLYHTHNVSLMIGLDNRVILREALLIQVTVIRQGCVTDTSTIMWSSQWQWSNTHEALFTKRVDVLPQDLVNSWSVRFGFRLFQSCWGLTDISTAGWFGNKTSYRLVIHYNDVIMGTMVSQSTSLTSVYPIVYSDADQRKHQSSVSLAFVWGIHRWPVNSPHKGPVARKMFPFDDVII